MNRRFIQKLQQSDRVFRYLYHLEGATTEELCSAAQCSQRTLMRVIGDLRRMCGADIRWDIKRQRYAMFNKRQFSPPVHPLDEHALIQIIYDSFFPCSRDDSAAAEEKTRVQR